MSRAPRVITVVAAWLLVALSLLGAVAYFHHAGNSVSLAVSALAPYLLFLALPAVALFLVARQWFPAGLAGVVLVGFVIVQVPVWRAAPAGTGRPLVVMTVNLRLGFADASSVVAAVRHRDVEALMLQELSPAAVAGLRDAGIDRLLPYHLAEPEDGAGGTGLWSRYPLTEIAWPQLSFHRIVARMAVPGMRTAPTVVALHVFGPVPSTRNWQLDLKRLPGMLRDLPRDAPVVIGGDFNATRSVAQFRGLLDDDYEDAADQAGAGLVRTYPSDAWFPPLLGIDHVVSRGAVAGGVDTVTISGSDHRALVVRLTLVDTR